MKPGSTGTITPTGQVTTSYEEESVFTINRGIAEDLMRRLRRSREHPKHLKQSVAAARRISGFEPQSEADRKPVFRGRYRRDGYVIEKWGVPGAGQSVLPLLLFLPGGNEDVASRPGVLIAAQDGKIAVAQSGQLGDQLVRRGYVVAAFDPLGFGETKNIRERYWHGPTQAFFTSQMFGRSVVAINAADITRIQSFLDRYPKSNLSSVGIYAKGDTGPAAMHAAAFGDRLDWIVVEDSLLEYSSIATNALHEINANSLVAGCLEAYDLPDLIAAAAPRRVGLIAPIDPLRRPMTADDVDNALRYPRRIFRESGADDHFWVTPPTTEPAEVIRWASGAE